MNANLLKPWQMSFNGRFWYEMPGACELDQKMNFFLFRRGKLDVEDEVQCAAYAADGIVEVPSAEDGAAAPVTVPARPRLRVKYQTRFGSIGRKRSSLVAGGVAAESPRAGAVDGRRKGSDERRALCAAARAQFADAGLVASFRALAGAVLANAVVKLRGGKAISEEMLTLLLEWLPAVQRHRREQESQWAEHVQDCDRLRAKLQGLKSGEVPWLAREMGMAEVTIHNFKRGEVPTMKAENVRRLEAALARMPANLPQRTRRALPGTFGNSQPEVAA